ncbi:MAG: type II toxin-antitoxin system RelE/ParE family toxin [Rickettsiales bacterium]
MILSYKDKRTEEFANGKRIKAFEAFSKQAEKRLEILDAAINKESLRYLPSNNFEALGGDRKGYYSIRINRKWRICFEWADGDSGASNVEIVDYH